MKTYWLSIFHPSDYNPSATEDESMIRDIDALNQAMIAAGVRRYANGLYPPATAKSFIRQTDGSLLEKAGAYLPTHEQVGGFWILETATEEEASEWARRAAIACRTAVELRPFH